MVDPDSVMVDPDSVMVDPDSVMVDPDSMFEPDSVTDSVVRMRLAGRDGAGLEFGRIGSSRRRRANLGRSLSISVRTP